MVTRPLYERGRLGAPISGPHGERPAGIEYELIEHLRAARAEGNEAMTAAEQYDPDFSVKLSACNDEADATRLLDAWLEHRVEPLKRTQANLRRIWESAQSNSETPSTAGDQVLTQPEDVSDAGQGSRGEDFDVNSSPNGAECGKS